MLGAYVGVEIQLRRVEPTTCGDLWRPAVHDFVIPEQGKAIPYGVYLETLRARGP